MFCVIAVITISSVCQHDWNLVIELAYRTRKDKVFNPLICSYQLLVTGFVNAPDVKQALVTRTKLLNQPLNVNDISQIKWWNTIMHAVSSLTVSFLLTTSSLILKRVTCLWDVTATAANNETSKNFSKFPKHWCLLCVLCTVYKKVSCCNFS